MDNECQAYVSSNDILSLERKYSSGVSGHCGQLDLCKRYIYMLLVYTRLRRIRFVYTLLPSVHVLVYVLIICLLFTSVCSICHKSCAV